MSDARALTAADLDALPVGVEVVDCDGDRWRKIESGRWHVAFAVGVVDAATLVRIWGPLLPSGAAGGCRNAATNPPLDGVLVLAWWAADGVPVVAWCEGGAWRRGHRGSTWSSPAPKLWRPIEAPSAADWRSVAEGGA